jgi:hypothetical protein
VWKRFPCGSGWRPAQNQTGPAGSPAGAVPPEAVENGLPLGCEAAEDQDYLGGEGLDDFPDAMVIQQQVQTLCHLEIVSGNRTLLLPLRADHQVPLNGLFQVDIPVAPVRSAMCDTPM